MASNWQLQQSLRHIDGINLILRRFFVRESSYRSPDKIKIDKEQVSLYQVVALSSHTNSLLPRALQRLKFILPLVYLVNNTSVKEMMQRKMIIFIKDI